MEQWSGWLTRPGPGNHFHEAEGRHPVLALVQSSVTHAAGVGTGSPDPTDVRAADRCAPEFPSASDPGRGEAASKGRQPDPGLPERVSSIDMCDPLRWLRAVRALASPVKGEAMPPPGPPYHQDHQAVYERKEIGTINSLKSQFPFRRAEV